jgi:hypothetical protein
MERKSSFAAPSAPVQGAFVRARPYHPLIDRKLASGLQMLACAAHSAQAYCPAVVAKRSTVKFSMLAM